MNEDKTYDYLLIVANDSNDRTFCLYGNQVNKGDDNEKYHASTKATDIYNALTHFNTALLEEAWQAAGSNSSGAVIAHRIADGSASVDWLGFNWKEMTVEVIQSTMPDRPTSFEEGLSYFLEANGFNPQA